MLYWHWFNRRQHPLARVLFGAIGAVLLVAILTLGFFALAAFALIAGVVLLLRALTHPGGGLTQRPVNPTNAIEGEYVVLPNSSAPLKP